MAQRPWARAGLMLANRGEWQGKAVVAEGWLTASNRKFAFDRLPLAKHGYQIWYSADTRRFGLRGLRRQFVFVDPDLKLVLMQTTLDGDRTGTAEVFALWTALRTQIQQGANADRFVTDPVSSKKRPFEAKGQDLCFWHF